MIWEFRKTLIDSIANCSWIFRGQRCGKFQLCKAFDWIKQSKLSINFSVNFVGLTTHFKLIKFVHWTDRIFLGFMG